MTNPFRDLTSPRWIHLKGWLFLVVGLLAGAGLLLDSPDLRTAVLLALCIWGFCRFYYYAFYVIEKYVDPRAKYSGLLDFLLRFLRSDSGQNPPG
jgi:hypothetical protein